MNCAKIHELMLSGVFLDAIQTIAASQDRNAVGLFENLWIHMIPSDLLLGASAIEALQMAVAHRCMIDYSRSTTTLINLAKLNRLPPLDSMIARYPHIAYITNRLAKSTYKLFYESQTNPVKRTTPVRCTPPTRKPTPSRSRSRSPPRRRRSPSSESDSSSGTSRSPSPRRRSPSRSPTPVRRSASRRYPSRSPTPVRRSARRRSASRSPTPVRRSASHRSPSAEIRRERTPSPECAASDNKVLCVGATSTASVNIVAASLSDIDKNVFKGDIGNWCVVALYKDKSLEDVATDLVNAVIIDKNSLPEALFLRAESIAGKTIPRDDHSPEAMTGETVVMFHDLARMIIELAQMQ